MSSNPWDNSSIILSNQSGANKARGIEQVANAFAQGIQGYFQRKEQDQKQEATVSWLEQSGAADQLFPQLAQVKDPGERRKVMMAGIKGAGLDNLVQVQQQLASQQRQQQEAQAVAELRKAQIAKTQADMEAQAHETAARRAALTGVPENIESYAARGGYLTRDPAAAQQRTQLGTPDEMLQAYGNAGGTDPRFIGALGAMGRDSAGTPQFMEDAVTGSRFAYNNKGQLVRSGVNPSKKAEDPSHGVQKVTIGDRNYFYHADSKRYFDETGAPIVFPSASSQSTADAINALAGGDGTAQPVESAAAGASAQNPVQPAPVTVTTKAEFDALQPGQSFIYNGRIGIKK